MRRRLTLAAGVVCAAAALTNYAGAQNAMPGQIVGSGYGTNVVGQQLPKAAPQAGQPIGLPSDTPLFHRYDPNRPYDALKGTNYTPDQVGAPIPKLTEDKTILEVIKGLFVKERPATPAPRSTYFPSLTRRNREREEARQWRRD